MNDVTFLNQFKWADEVAIYHVSNDGYITGKLLSINDHRVVLEVTSGAENYEGEPLDGKVVIIMTHQIGYIEMLGKKSESEKEQGTEP